MKKLFFLLFSITALFSSCSSDDDNLAQTDPNPIAKTYPVELNIKSRAFNIDKTPLTKSSSFGDARFLQIIAYKESGELFSSTVYTPKQTDSIAKANNNELKIEIKLPEGKFNLSTVVYPMESNLPNGFKANNFATDYFMTDDSKYNIGTESNYETYYNTQALSVSKDNSNSFSATLAPMWSEFKLTLDGIKTSAKPEGTDAIIVKLNNLRRGFTIKTGMADTLAYIDGYKPETAYAFALNLEKQIAGNSIEVGYSTSVASSNNTISYDIKYLKQNGANPTNGNPYSGTYTVLATRSIILPDTLKNGYVYNISGNLKDVTYNQSTSISLGEFNSTPIYITF